MSRRNTQIFAPLPNTTLLSQSKPLVSRDTVVSTNGTRVNLVKRLATTPWFTYACAMISPCSTGEMLPMAAHVEPGKRDDLFATDCQPNQSCAYRISALL